MENYSNLEIEAPIIDLENKITELRTLFLQKDSLGFNLDKEILSLEQKRDELMKEIFSNLTPWQRVQLARHPKRPHALDYIKALAPDFVELHGDRNYGDDPALVGGIGTINGCGVVLMGQQKGRTVEDSMHRNFGMMHPEGYRKALRLMKLAEKFSKPVITFIDTAGAFPGIGAEERGQAEAIARNLKEMSILKVPSISIVIGEGGSGGALGIGVTDKILMLENSWYSVISPEGCAAILFRDASKAQQAATALKPTAQDLLRLGIIDAIIPEPLGGAHRDIDAVVAALSKELNEQLDALRKLSIEKLIQARYNKYRKMGSFEEPRASSATKNRQHTPLETAEKPSKKKTRKI